MLLAYGGGSIKRSGVYGEVLSLLREAGKEVVEFGGIMPNPTYAKAQEGAALACEHGVDFILAIGGGSVIDCCKVISAQAMLEEDIWNMEYQSGKFPTAGIPMGAVVTASGTGAEMNAGGVITHEEKQWKGGIWGTAPSFAVLDPAYTLTVPHIGHSPTAVRTRRGPPSSRCSRYLAGYIANSHGAPSAFLVQ